MLLRRTVQFHWRNDAYADFEGFLARLSHARRKNIRQERRKLRAAGVSCRWLEGGAIERRHWEFLDRKSTRLNSSHGYISYAVFCLKKKKSECMGIVVRKLCADRVRSAVLRSIKMTL